MKGVITTDNREIKIKKVLEMKDGTYIKLKCQILKEKSLIVFRY